MASKAVFVIELAICHRFTLLDWGSIRDHAPFLGPRPPDVFAKTSDQFAMPVSNQKNGVGVDLQIAPSR
jgi:hypothetical protein